jgi:hypothetical protein
VTTRTVRPSAAVQSFVSAMTIAATTKTTMAAWV